MLLIVKCLPKGLLRPKNFFVEKYFAPFRFSKDCTIFVLPSGDYSSSSNLSGVSPNPTNYSGYDEQLPDGVGELSAHHQKKRAAAELPNVV